MFLEAGLGDLTNTAATAAETAASFAGDWSILLLGLVLIIATVIIIHVVKKVFINSILGIIGWAIAVFVFQIELPFLPSLVVSAIFGLAGIGVMLLLKFLAII